jgi:hypothetical protein
MAQIAITLDQVKTYLVISASDYDANISGIITEWTDTLELMLKPDVLSDSSIQKLLHTGKLMYISGYVKNALPAPAMASGIQSIRMGTYQETDASVASSRSGKNGDGMIMAAQKLLSPYFKSEYGLTGALPSASSRSNADREFRLPVGDDTGTMEGW